MIWAAKKGSKGESLQNALKILCDFCLLLLKQLIPARGRKLKLEAASGQAIQQKQLIPARGRKLMGDGQFRFRRRNNSSPRGDGNDGGAYYVRAQIRNNSSPRGDGNLCGLRAITCGFKETTHPREGTETSCAPSAPCRI